MFLAVRGRHEHVHIVIEHLLRRVAEQPLGGWIERFDAAMRVDHDDAVDGRVDDRSPPCLAFPKLAFEAHALRQIVQHARELAFASHPHLGDGQLDRKQRAVAAAPSDFTADADDRRFTGLEVAFQVFVMLLMLWRGHQQADVAAHHLRFGVSKQVLSAPVERFDVAPGIDDDDAVERRVEDGVETLGAGVGHIRGRLLRLAGLMQAVIEPRDHQPGRGEHAEGQLVGRIGDGKAGWRQQKVHSRQH